MRLLHLLKNEKEPEWTSHHAKKEEITSQKIKKLDTYEEEIGIYERLDLMLVALDLKKGTDIEVFFRSQESFGNFVKMLTKLGINVYALHNPENTQLENFSSVFGEKEIIRKTKDKLNREVVARLFLTKDNNYDLKFFRELTTRPKNKNYHITYGKFLGYPEKDIKTFLDQQKPNWRIKIDKIRGKTPRKPLNLVKGLENSNFSDEEKKTTKALTNHIVCGEKDCLDRAVESCMKKRRKLEDYGIDMDDKIDRMTF